MVVLLALVAAVAYGVGDFVGGLAARQRAAITILLYSYPVGALLMCAMLPVFPGTLNWPTLGYGAAGGVAGLVGVTLLYSLMAVAPMNIISPITAVLAAAVPVVFGVLTGERPGPAAWAGIALGLLAVVLVSRTPEDHPHGPLGSRVLALAVLSGLGFGVYFICLAQPAQDSGLWPVVISRAASAVLIVALARRTANVAHLPPRLLVLAATAGVLDAAANLFFLLASRQGFLSLASVITSLYPAATVLLSIAVLHEHTGRMQRVGLALAAGSIVLVTR